MNPDLAASGSAPQESDTTGRPSAGTHQRSPSEPRPPGNGPAAAPQRPINGPGLSPPQSTASDMDALSRASARFAHGKSPTLARQTERSLHRPASRANAPNFALALFVALLVGAGVFLTGRFQYQTSATFIIPDTRPAADSETIRKELLDHAWLTLTSPSRTSPPTRSNDRTDLNNRATIHGMGTQLTALSEPHIETDNYVTDWFLDTPHSNALRINVLNHHPDRAGRLLRELAVGFIDQQRAAAASRRQVPTEAERWLTDYAQRLRTELADAENQVNAAIAALPADDPNEQRMALLDRWQSVRFRFEATRSELTDASSSLARIREQPEPTHGIVLAHERQTELEADDALQADLRELAVNLAEVKLQLLNIAAQSRPPLQQLESAGQSLHEVLLGLDRTRIPATMRDAMDRLVAESEPYHQALQAFTASWDRAMNTLSERDVDPMSGEILDLHRECVGRINEFLFASARHLTAMRTHVATIGQTASDNARHHVLQSDVVRAFQQLQTAHHRFEFSAGRLAGADNFRLDAARRSAQGLRHRTQIRIRDIDRRLQELAVQRARDQQARDLAAAEEMVKRIRSATDRTVDDLVVLQERLNAAVADSDAFHAAMRGLDLAMGRLEATRIYLGETETRLAGLEESRLAAQDDFDMTFTIEDAATGPINLNDRIRSGLITAGLVFLTVMLGQWWIGRRA